MTIAAVLLAAGGSARMGASGPKQLLAYEGEPLVRRAARAILEAGFSPLIVVVGHESARTRDALAGLPFLAEENTAWHLGLGSSLKRGISRALLELPTTQGTLVSLSDQPFVSREHLSALLSNFRPAHPIASLYHGTPSVPAILPATMFADVMQVPDTAGAKPLLANADTLPLADPTDIDTPEDYARLTSTP